MCTTIIILVELTHLKWLKDTREDVKVDAGERLEAVEGPEDRSDDPLSKKKVVI